VIGVGETFLIATAGLVIAAFAAFFLMPKKAEGKVVEPAPTP
jgi:ABC-type phosphate/phosphonate transport system permease subunit